MLDLEDMTASKLRACLEGDDEDSYSERFGKNTYKTIASRLGEYGSQCEHLAAVLESMDEGRPVKNILARMQNPAMVLRIFEAMEADTEDIEKAYNEGKAAWNDDLLSQGVCGTACAAIRKAMWEAICSRQPDVSDQEAAA